MTEFVYVLGYYVLKQMFILELGIKRRKRISFRKWKMRRNTLGASETPLKQLQLEYAVFFKFP